MGLMFAGGLGTLKAVDVRSAAFICAGGLIAGLLGQFAFYSALKSGEASLVVPVAATYPLVALIVSALFLGEAVTLQKAAGIILVAGGVMLLR